MKTVTRSKSSATGFTKFAMQNVAASVSASGSFLGYSASLEVDVNTFRESMSEGTKFGENSYTFTLGGDDSPEPIAIKIVPIDEAFNEVFYASIDASELSNNCSFKRSVLLSKRANVQKALANYATIKGAIKPEEPRIRIPLSWPGGRYGLPMPTSGCPIGTAFEWFNGTRYHDTEDSNPGNHWSNPNHLSGLKQKNDMEQKFCMKTAITMNMYDLGWPEGKYCIFKKGECPKDLGEGSIKWDDEDSANKNRMHGSLPDGVYGSDTIISFCCRTDGYTTNEILLPTEKPFVLFKSNSHQCQRVRGMRSTTEWLAWDCEDETSRNQVNGAAPRTTATGTNIKIEYCYYTPKHQENVCTYVCEKPK